MSEYNPYPKLSEKYRFEWISAEDQTETCAHLHPVMNNTKWDELRLSMHDLGCDVSFRTKVLGTRWVTDWDSEWFYHFRWGGYVTDDSGDRFVAVHRETDKYKNIEWAELHFRPEDLPKVLVSLAAFSIPYEPSENGLKIFGYIDDTGRLTVTKL